MDLTADRNSLRVLAQAQRAELQQQQQARNAAKLAMPCFPRPVPICEPDATGTLPTLTIEY